MLRLAHSQLPPPCFDKEKMKRRERESAREAQKSLTDETSAFFRSSLVSPLDLLTLWLKRCGRSFCPSSNDCDSVSERPF